MVNQSAPSAGFIRLATASPATQSTTRATLAQLRQIAQRAAATHRADILLLPEAYLGGYPRGQGFGCVVGGRSREGRDAFLRYFEDAVDLGDVVGMSGEGGGEAWVRRQLPPVVADDDGGEDYASKRGRGDGSREELEAIARETGVFLVVGCIEKAGGSLYCAAVYVCPSRGMIGKRRKVMPTGSERLIWAQGSPKTLQAVSTTIRNVRINMAVAICWESYMPLLRQTLYAQNINLYLAPTADGRDAWLSLMRTVGIEGRCFVVSSNMCCVDDRNGSDAQPYEEEATMVMQGGGSSNGNSRLRNRKRRKSVLDENGNEIVLCCEEDEGLESASAVVDSEAVHVNGAAGKGDRTFLSRGGSCITDPFGEVLAGPQWEDDEGLICADVDFRDCIRGRLDLDAAGSYSRNDSFKFSVEGLDLTPLPYQ